MKTKKILRIAIKGELFRQDRLCTGSCRLSSRPGEYLEIPVSCSEIWRWDLPAGLSDSDSILWLCADHVRDSSWKNDQKKSGWCLCTFWVRQSHLRWGGWLNAVIPMLIVPYYSSIGGWVVKYLVEYLQGNVQKVSQDGYFMEALFQIPFR